MPGHEKIVSVTIVPASSVPNCRPRIVMIGISALRTAYHARKNRGQRCTERRCRKNIVAHTAAAGDRQQADLDGENQNQHRTERKIWKRQSEQREKSDGTVGALSSTIRREDSGGNRDRSTNR